MVVSGRNSRLGLVIEVEMVGGLGGGIVGRHSSRGKYSSICADIHRGIQ